MLNALDFKTESETIARCELQLATDELLRALLALEPARRLSLLDSGGARPPDARYFIAGFDPFEIVEARGEELKIIRRGASRAETLRGDALRVLDERLAEHRVRRQPAAQVYPACIATFAYELVRSLERLRAINAARTSDEPDVVLAFYDTLVVHDYEQGRTEIVSIGGARRLKETADALLDAARDARLEEDKAAATDALPATHRPAQDAPRIVSNMTRDEYQAAVGCIKERIAAGDIYQANLTQQFVCSLDALTTPERIFVRLRRDHPASFAAFIRRRADTVISASPERFLRVEPAAEGRRIEAWPIKGTRPRGASAGDDARLRAELLSSEKDRAENVMIVDLMRNDLGRVCRYGSVEVAELCALQEHPTLFHLVSKVRGVLREDVTAGALLRATFPCGSVTGAPKIRAMEIINDIESAPRGLSMGAIGYFGFDGALDLSVAIRTMVVHDGIARFNVGGGIVADSSPALEYEESLVKARALLNALGVERQG